MTGDIGDVEWDRTIKKLLDTIGMSLGIILDL